MTAHPHAPLHPAAPPSTTMHPSPAVPCPSPTSRCTPSLAAPCPIPHEWTTLDDCGRANNGARVAIAGPRRRTQAWAASRHERITRGATGHSHKRERAEQCPPDASLLTTAVPHQVGRGCRRCYVSNVLGVSDLCFKFFIWVLQKYI
jgi:hypothetical protein